MKKALITGGTGYIGRHLVDLLIDQGWSVDMLVRPTSPFRDQEPAIRHVYDGGLASIQGALEVCAPDVVFHLASAVIPEHRVDQLDELIDSNIRFPAQLFEAMAITGHRRLVNTGTFWQYFEKRDYWPVDLYAATKQSCEDILLYYHDRRQLSAITLVLFDTYGENDSRRKVISLMVDATISGRSLGMSPGMQLLDLTHVQDIARAFLVAADRLLSSNTELLERFAVSGERMTLRDVAALIEQEYGTPPPLEFGARPYRDREIMEPVASLDPLPDWTRSKTITNELRLLLGRAA